MFRYQIIFETIVLTILLPDFESAKLDLDATGEMGVLLGIVLCCGDALHCCADGFEGYSQTDAADGHSGYFHDESFVGICCFLGVSFRSFFFFVSYFLTVVSRRMEEVIG
jgi:hypothetical protein